MPELIVRIFLAGLILIVPQDHNTPNNKDDDTLVAYLVNDADHTPLLRYCKKFDKAGRCMEETDGTPGRKVELRGSEVSFGFSEGTSAQAEGEHEDEMGSSERTSNSPSPAARGYHCVPGNKPPHGHVELCNSDEYPPRKFPEKREYGTDFDWVAKLSEILTSSGSLDTTPSKYAAVVEFSQGTASVCGFVKVRENCVVENGDKKKFVVPLVSFEDDQGNRGNLAPRAVASSLVVELVGKEAEDFIVELEKLGKSQEISPGKRKCSDHGRPMDKCIEIAITNLPDGDKVTCMDKVDQNIKRLTSGHWRNYYNLLEPKPAHEPYPRPVAGIDFKEPKDVATECLIFPPLEDMASESWPEQLVEILDLKDRPICPIGTP